MVFDRVTGARVAGLPNPLNAQAALYADSEILAQTEPGCCGSGVTLYDPNNLVEDQVIEPGYASNTVARRGQRLIEGDEYGRVQVWDLATNPARLLDYADLRVLTGHTGSEDIEIRGVWTDSIDNLVFAGSDWGNDQSRSASLPAFFVLELVEDPLTASITSPPNGATVSGTVTINMSAGNAQGGPTQFVLTLDNAATLASQSVSVLLGQGGDTFQAVYSAIPAGGVSHRQSPLRTKAGFSGFGKLRLAWRYPVAGGFRWSEPARLVRRLQSPWCR